MAGADARWAGLQEKSRECLKAARAMLAGKNFDGAANRLYWATFMAGAFAISARLRKENRELGGHEDRWEHHVVRNNAMAAFRDPGTGGRLGPNDERRIRANYRILQGLRIKADYTVEGVVADEIEGMDEFVENVMRFAGVGRGAA